MKTCSCGTALAVQVSTPGIWQALCPRCFDHADDASPKDRVWGYGASAEAAIESWEESHALAHDT